MESTITPKFQTIRQIAKSGLVSEHYLRQLVKMGQCPGFYAGSRFMVNANALLEQLDSAGRKAAAVNE